MDKLTKDVYRKIYSDLVNALKADFARLLTREQIEFIEQNWRKRLEESKIFLNDLDSPVFSAIRLMNQSITFVKAPAMINGMPVVPLPPEPLPPRPTLKAEEQRRPDPLPPIRETPEPTEKLTAKIEISLNLKVEEAPASPKEEAISADDDDLFGEEVRPRTRRAVREELTAERVVEEERSKMLMLQKIDDAIKQDEEELKQDFQDDAEEPLNSQDDVEEYKTRIPTGKNLFLAYFDKAIRKKDKRKISFRSCILRLGNMEILLPFAKGDFLWVGNRRCSH